MPSSSSSFSPSSTFQVLDVAHSLVPLLREPLQRLARRDRALADQLYRAVSSVPLNIAEGNRRAGKDRIHLWRVAAGSAESWARMAGDLSGPLTRMASDASFEVDKGLVDGTVNGVLSAVRFVASEAVDTAPAVTPAIV